jgi:hypothetical protein
VCATFAGDYHFHGSPEAISLIGVAVVQGGGERLN